MLADGLLYVADQVALTHSLTRSLAHRDGRAQIPGYVVSDDLTPLLREQLYFVSAAQRRLRPAPALELTRGRQPSYNIPYHRFVYNIRCAPASGGHVRMRLTRPV